MTLPLIDEARAAGASLWLIGEDQIGFRFADKPPPGLLARLRGEKNAILARLKAERDASDEARRWRSFYKARAAAHGADAARAHLIAQWRCEHPPEPTEPADGCVQCGLPLGDDAVAMLAGADHAWRHRACWAAYDARRQAEAESAVRALLGAAP